MDNLSSASNSTVTNNYTTFNFNTMDAYKESMRTMTCPSFDDIKTEVEYLYSMINDPSSYDPNNLKDISSDTVLLLQLRNVTSYKNWTNTKP